MQVNAKERGILELLGQGMTREQIAERDGKSWKSVKIWCTGCTNNYCQNYFRYLKHGIIN